ncbi:hypothetical protein [Methyloraptor flagellatus]|uniref:Uncharacterized protein n=1 Tax=Methyloraptor flagellatus TaxID=3162530 RepID=A0AAU7X7W1_9HYPH
MLIRKTLYALVTAAVLGTAGVAGSVGTATTAEAQGYWDGRPHRWDGPPPRRWDGPYHHRPRCWFERRPVRVWTEWGPRVRYREVRVCR